MESIFRNFYKYLFLYILPFYLLISLIQIVFLWDIKNDLKSDHIFILDFILFIYSSIFIRELYIKSEYIIKEVTDKLKIDYETEFFEANKQLNDIRMKLFTLKNFLKSGIIGGFFVCLVIYFSGVVEEYPHMIFHFFFGFNHGIGLLIGLKAYSFCKKVGSSYIKTIDILDPDGMGGFKKISKTFENSIFLFIFGIILDTLILYPTFNDNSDIFKIITKLLLSLTLFISSSILMLSFFRIWKTLEKEKQKKIEFITKYYNEAERRFWKNLSDGSDVSADSLALISMNEMFEKINNVKMWPLYKIFLKAILLVSALMIFFLKISAESVITTGFVSYFQNFTIP